MEATQTLKQPVLLANSPPSPLSLRADRAEMEVPSPVFLPAVIAAVMAALPPSQAAALVRQFLAVRQPAAPLP